MKVNITMNVAQLLFNMQGAQLPEKIIFDEKTYTLNADNKYVDNNNKELIFTMSDYEKPVVVEDRLRVQSLQLDTELSPTEEIFANKLQEIITVVNMICERFDNE